MQNDIIDSKYYLSKAQAWCALQDRCIFETKRKLTDWECPFEYQDSIIEKLIEDKFLDEQRYCDSFVRGKFNTKHWGKNKIRYELQSRRLCSTQIESSLMQIIETDYFSTLDLLLRKKLKDIKDKEESKRKLKLINFARSKGYEYEYISKCLKHILS
ncbi:MAG: RecX family transcriptional regulator [Bacteroidales bacterium]|nr:RecX family transcriptional regulator [Bacteroidales bacterium]